MIDYEKLWERIPVGEENAIGLETLTDLLGCRTTRQARKDIEKMINNDLMVCNLIKGEGYFRPGCIEELIAFRRIVLSYKNKWLKKDYRIKKAIANKRYVTC